MVNQNNQIKISAETRRSIFDKIMSHADFWVYFKEVIMKIKTLLIS